MTADLSSPSSPHQQLRVRTFAGGQGVVVVVSGEADVATAALVRDALAVTPTCGPGSLVVDATDLTFCDLRGLDALTDAVAVAERSGFTVTIRPSAHLSWLLATLERASQTSGRPGPDPFGRPLPSSARRTA